MQLSSEQEKILDKQLDLTLKLNQIHNLTNIKDKELAKVLHIEDSLAAFEFISKLNTKNRFVDLGSGSGYPGICLSIVSNISCDLIESITKKADCLKTIISGVGKETSISVINKRIEDYSVNNDKYYDFATARALASLPSLLELASPLISINGYLICYKGDEIEEELDQSLIICKKLGFELFDNITYKLSNGAKHRLIIYKKFSKPTIKLPRRVGLAQKKPLS